MNCVEKYEKLAKDTRTVLRAIKKAVSGDFGRFETDRDIFYVSCVGGGNCISSRLTNGLGVRDYIKTPITDFSLISVLGLWSVKMFELELLNSILLVSLFLKIFWG